MAFKEIADALHYPEGSTARYKRLDALDRLLDNTFYDDIAYSFEQERISSEYLPLTKRRPSVTYNLARIVVDQSSGSLWVDDEIAEIVAEGSQQSNVDAIGDEVGYDAVFMEAYERSAAGSGAIILHGHDGEPPIIESVPGKFLRPLWSFTKPNTLDALERAWPVTRADLIASGIPLPDDKDHELFDAQVYWLRVVYTSLAELRYAPLRADHFVRLGQKKDGPTEEKYAWLPAKDAEGGVWPHRWGAVPAVYVRSLLFGRDELDGRCAYSDIADTQVEIARSLSQVGRGFRYSADPLIYRDDGDMLRAVQGIDPLSPGGDALTGPNGEFVRSVSNILPGKHALLEPTGAGLLGTLEYVKLSREWALEVAGAMKADAATTKGAMSGTALNKLEEMSRLLVKRQRIAYGTRGLIPFVKLVLRGCANGACAIQGVAGPNPESRIRLDWPQHDPAELDSDVAAPVPTKTTSTPSDEE